MQPVIVKTVRVKEPVYVYIEIDPALTEPLLVSTPPVPTNGDLLDAYIEALAKLDQCNLDRSLVEEVSEAAQD